MATDVSMTARKVTAKPSAENAVESDFFVHWSNAILILLIFMALTINRVERENELNTILVFARQLEETLHRGHPPATLKTELHQKINDANGIQNALAAGRKVDLDKLGTTLWNSASRLKDDNANHSELFGLVRIFACLLLDCAQRCTQGSSNDIRLLKSSLRASKYCLDQGHLSLADIIVGKAAFYNDRLQNTPHGHNSIGNRLSKEYLILRIGLAWKQDRLDLAKLMLAKLASALAELDPALAEELSDVLFEIGNERVKKSLWSDAIPWLEKAHEALACQNRKALSNDAVELRVSIMVKMAKSLINVEIGHTKARAWNVIRELDTECGDCLVVLLLKIELYAADSGSTSQEYCDILHKIIRAAHLTDLNLKAVLHHVHILRIWNPIAAHTVLTYLLSERLLGTEQSAWLEKIFVIIIWNCTTSTEFPDAMASLDHVFDTTAAASSITLSTSATHAAQILLWRRIELFYDQEMYDAAGVWCRLSLHEVLRNSGEFNVAKIQRKLMLCELGNADPEKARNIHSEMSESTQESSSTQYILYKIALKCRDMELATHCLDSICTSSKNDATLLYACVLEAQRTGDHVQVTTALQRVLDKYNYNAPNGAHLPALLRCTARVLIREISNYPVDGSSGINDICRLFEGEAATQAEMSQRDAKCDIFPLAELDWFSRNSYNLALNVCTSWDPSQTLRLMLTCMKLVDLYPNNLDPNVLTDLSLRRLFCEFVIGSLLIVVARNENDVEDQLQHYLNLRKIVNGFRSNLQVQLNRLEGGARKDLQRKHTSLLAFDFEAATRLKAWASLEEIIEESQHCDDPEIYATLADITLTSGAPSEIVVTALQRIVNITWRHENNNIDKLCRWIRCLFSIALTSQKEIAERLLGQVVTIAENAHKQKKVYPAEELEWLAATTFNHAIDFYCSSQEVEFRRWAEKAFVLANLCQDDCVLQKLLQKKYESLVWHEL